MDSVLRNITNEIGGRYRMKDGSRMESGNATPCLEGLI